MRPLSARFPALLAAFIAALLALATAVAVPAFADTPPWEPDPNAVGTLTFYDGSGNVITSGSTDTAPFAAYAVGSATVRSGDVQGGLFFANPDPNSVPQLWYKEQVGVFTHYPLTSGPANVKQLSQTQPVNAGGSSDQTLDGFRSDLSSPSQQDGYKNVVQVFLRTADANGQQSTQYDDADLLIDPANHTWTQVYPGNLTTTSTTLSASPNPAKQGATVTLTAAETPVAAGTVQFKDGSKNIGSPVAVDSSGMAQTTTSTLSAGSHSLTATFTPTDASTYTSSTGSATESITAVPDPSALTIAGPKSVKKGKTFALTGKLTDSKTHAVLGRQHVTLYKRPSSHKPFTKVKTVSTSGKGVATVKLSERSTTQYEWRYAGTSKHKACTSPVKTVKAA